MTRLRAPLACAMACAALAVALLALVLAPAAVALAATPAPSAASGVTLADYAVRVGQARGLARDADPALTADAAVSLADRIGALLPDGETVSVGETAVRADQSVLSGLLSALSSARTSSERAEALERIGAHLDSLALASGGTAGGTATVRSDPAALRALLAGRTTSGSNSISDLLRGLLERVTKWLRENLGGLLTPEQSSRLDSVVWTVVIAGLALVLLYVGVRAYFAARASIGRADAERLAMADTGTPVVAAAEGLPPDALAYADELAAAGEYRAAVRALFGGAARRLVEAGAIAQTRTRTDAELLAEIAPSAPRAHPPLSALTRSFERAWYGHADPGEHGFAEARELYAGVLKAVAA